MCSIVSPWPWARGQCYTAPFRGVRRFHRLDGPRGVWSSRRASGRYRLSREGLPATQVAGFFLLRRSDMSRFIFTSESVSEGHPDKVCDYISDSILDACLEHDTASRVACETLCKSDTVVIAGEITTHATLDYDQIVREAVKEIGYTDTSDRKSVGQGESR